MLDKIERLRQNVASVYLGDVRVIDRLILCLLARGHALLEDVPGVGKTVLASSIARSIEGSFSRVQLTPDMLPADVLGVTIYDKEGHRFEFRRGPIFANIVLADEINRTTPRTQTALLEAMSDGSVSIDGTEHTLEPPFIVLATQNPYEFEGTYLLPENQLDRFLVQAEPGLPLRGSGGESARRPTGADRARPPRARAHGRGGRRASARGGQGHHRRADPGVHHPFRAGDARARRGSRSGSARAGASRWRRRPGRPR
jgi:MoxR-like ATPase